MWLFNNNASGFDGIREGASGAMARRPGFSGCVYCTGKPGALNSVLNCFQKRGVSLARIESKFNDPLAQEPAHSFLIDIYRPERSSVDYLLADLKTLGPRQNWWAAITSLGSLRVARTWTSWTSA